MQPRHQRRAWTYPLFDASDGSETQWAAAAGCDRAGGRKGAQTEVCGGRWYANRHRCPDWLGTPAAYITRQRHSTNAVTSILKEPPNPTLPHNQWGASRPVAHAQAPPYSQPVACTGATTWQDGGARVSHKPHAVQRACPTFHYHITCAKHADASRVCVHPSMPQPRDTGEPWQPSQGAPSSSLATTSGALVQGWVQSCNRP